MRPAENMVIVQARVLNKATATLAHRTHFRELQHAGYIAVVKGNPTLAFLEDEVAEINQRAVPSA